MIIYLDESKRIGKWEIVVWGFLSENHNTAYIHKFMKLKLKDFNISDTIELKSTNKFWKKFIFELMTDKDFDKLDIHTFSFHFKEYYIESPEGYMNLLIKIFTEIFSYEWKINKKIIIVHDNINTKDNRVFENKISNYVSEKFGYKVEFTLKGSKNDLNLQLADIIVWEYKKLYFFDDVNNLEHFLEMKNLDNKKT